MVANALASSYNSFLEEAARGGFQEPASGWNAGMILAHVVINDQRLTAITREVCAGRSLRNDNGDAADTESLRQLAERLGWDGLLEEVRSVGSGLMIAVSEMTEEQGQRLVDSHIVDGGVVVVDDAVPWSRLLMVHAQHHLPDHTRQLAALRG